MDAAEVPLPQELSSQSRRTRLLWALALVLTIVAPFAVAWLRGESLMAALAGPGLTLEGPTGQVAGVAPPYADAVAAYIDEPLAALRHDLIAAGDPDTWNPHNGLGVPLYGNWQSSIDSPLRLLVHWAPRSAWAFDVTYVLRLVLAGLGAFLLADRLGVRGVGSFATGVAFGLTGYFVRYLPMHHLNAEVLLPWLLWTSDLLQSRKVPVRALFAHVLVAWCIVVGGNPQPALVAAFTTLLFAVARTRQHGIGSLFWVGLASLPAILLAAPYCLAGFEYVGVAVHHHDATYGGDAYTLAGGLGFVVPEPFSVPRTILAAGEVRHGMQPLHGLVAPYFGITAIALAAFGAAAGALRGPCFWLLLAVFGGKLVNLPVVAWLGEVPGFAQMKIFKYGYPPAALALALLAGNGVHVVASRVLGKRRLLVAVSVVAVLCGVLYANALGAAHRLADLGVSLCTFGPLLLVVFLVVALALAARGVSRVPRGTACSMLLALEFVIAPPSQFMPRTQPFAPPQYLKALAARSGTSRVMPMLGMLMPNQNSVFGIDALTLHDGVFPARYGALVRELLNPNVRRWPVFTGEDLGERPAALILGALRISIELLPQRVTLDVQPSVRVDLLDPLHSKLLDLCNVRFLVLPSLESTRAWVKTWPKEAGALTYEDAQALVFERKEPLARAFFPAKVAFVEGARQALEALRAPTFSPREVAVLEAAGPGNTNPETTGRAEHDGTATQQDGVASAYVETRKHATEFEISAQTTKPSWLVISHSVFPGWRAEIDGKPTSLVPADLVGCAVQVPKGRHRVRLYYEPTWRTPGLALAAFGALLMLALALLGHRNARTRG